MELNLFTLDKPNTPLKTLNRGTFHASDTHKNVSQNVVDRLNTIESLKDHVDVDAETKRDEIFEQSLIRIDAELKSQGFAFTKNGLLSLNSFTNIPNSMCEYLYTNHDWADYAGYANRELDGRELSARMSKNFLLRFRKVGDEDVIRAVMSDRYGVIDHNEVLKAICYSLPGGKADTLLAQYTYDSDDMTGSVILPDYIQSSSSEYSSGFSFGNSEIKNKSFTIRPFLYSAVTDSGYIWSHRDATVSINIKHSGKIDFNNIRTRVTQGIETALSQGQNIVNLLEMSKTISVDNGLRVIAALSRDHRLTTKQGKNWHKYYLQNSFQGTAYGVLSSMSESSNTFDGETREYMQLAVTQMLAPRLNTSQNDLEKRWERINGKSQLLEPQTVKQYEFFAV